VEGENWMRCNQVSILIERFGDYVPKGYPNDIQRISVYCDDSTSIYAALAKANAMAVNELNEHEEISVKSYTSTNAYSQYNYREMHGTEPKDKSNYDDLELELRYKSDELRTDRIWVHENIDDILKVIQTAENKKDMIFNLKEKFGLSDFQIRKLLSFRLDMLSKSDYSKDVEEQKKFEDRKNRHEGWSETRWTDYCRLQIREEEKKIQEYNACITIAENYQDMMSIISENPIFSDYAKILSEKYGFDRNQASLVKMMTVDDLLSADKYREKVEKCEAEIEQYRNWLNESKVGKNR
jgi:hypothetical protein